MSGHDEHVVGLRELRHRTGEVLARVRDGETIDVTEYGRPIARIVPIVARPVSPVLDQLVTSGRAVPATRRGYRPVLRAGDGAERLGAALAELRADDRW